MWFIRSLYFFLENIGHLGNGVRWSRCHSQEVIHSLLNSDNLNDLK